ncbi:MAG: glutamyl-tRNA reductase, partial [Acidimicrobiales bacterium]
MSVVVVGLNHRTVPLAVLEPMTVRGPALAKALADLRGRHNIGEAVVLSTCNRTEIYAVAERYHGAIADVRNFLSEHSGLAPDAFGDHLYAYHDETAVAHLFRVACGLDSAVVGETEILGQVREAWELARDEGAAGATLGRLFGHALAVGRRARAETAISRGTTSVAQAAVAMAAERLGSLEGRVVLVVGAGDVGQATAMALAAAPRVGQVVVANRSSDAAQALAVRVGGRAVGFSGLAPALAEVDVVFTCTGASVPVVDAVDLAPVITARAGRPLLIVDVAVPRDVDPGVADLAGVTLLDMDDLRASA